VRARTESVTRPRLQSTRERKCAFAAGLTRIWPSIVYFGGIYLYPLTVKLRGRPEAPDQAPRAHNLFRARGADTQAVHGPLQRLLEATPSLLPSVAPIVTGTSP
jgi:hypothetical protein